MLQSQRATLVTLISTVLKTDGSTTTASHDMSGCKAAAVIVNLSLEEGTDANNPTVSLTEGDTTDATNQATIVSNSSVDLQTARSVIIHFQPRKKVLKLSVTAGTGTGNDISFGANLLKFRQEQEPASTTDMIASTNDVAKVR